MLDTCPYTFVQMYNIKSVLIMVCQCKFTNYIKCTTMVEDVDHAGGYVGTGSIGKSLYLLLSFAVVLKVLQN